MYSRLSEASDETFIHPAGVDRELRHAGRLFPRTPGAGDGAVGESRAAAEPAPRGRLYVTNEISGDLSVIDVASERVIATIPLGKRPRGVRVSPDHSTLYVALSGSPIAPPGVDEETLPPADKKADGIGVFDIKSGKLLRVMPGGSDPEQLAVSTDGKWLFIANEDVGETGVVDASDGKVIATIRWAASPKGWTAARRQGRLRDVRRRQRSIRHRRSAAEADHEVRRGAAAAVDRVPARQLPRICRVGERLLGRPSSTPWRTKSSRRFRWRARWCAHGGHRIRRRAVGFRVDGKGEERRNYRYGDEQAYRRGRGR